MAVTTRKARGPQSGGLPTFTAVREEADLPQAARDYLAFLGDFLGVPIALVSVGPGRDQVIWTDTGRKSAVALTATA